MARTGPNCRSVEELLSPVDSNTRRTLTSDKSFENTCYTNNKMIKSERPGDVHEGLEGLPRAVGQPRAARVLVGDHAGAAEEELEVALVHLLLLAELAALHELKHDLAQEDELVALEK